VEDIRASRAARCGEAVGVPKNFSEPLKSIRRAKFLLGVGRAARCRKENPETCQDGPEALPRHKEMTRPVLRPSRAVPGRATTVGELSNRAGAECK
jgi:hypothetical protein